MDLVKQIDSQTLKSLYTDLSKTIAIDKSEELRRSEKKNRRRMDDFRYDMKKIEPSIKLDSKWEDVKLNCTKLEYYNVLSEEMKIEAFEKYLRRLKV